MALIFLNVLTNIVSDAGQYRCVVNWGAIIDEAHMSEPELGNCNYEDSAKCLFKIDSRSKICHFEQEDLAESQ